MELWPWDRPETDEERYERLNQMMEEAYAFAARPREEVVGHPHEKMWYMHRLVRVMQEGTPDEVRSAVAEMLEKAPTEGRMRLMASGAYSYLGDEAEALAQLGIALALEPELYPAHRWLAAALLKRGERDAAQRVLETGWEYRRKCVSRRDLAQERDHWFGLMEGKPTPVPSEAP